MVKYVVRAGKLSGLSLICWWARFINIVGTGAIMVKDVVEAGKSHQTWSSFMKAIFSHRCGQKQE